MWGKYDCALEGQQQLYTIDMSSRQSKPPHITKPAIVCEY